MKFELLTVTDNIVDKFTKKSAIKVCELNDNKEYCYKEIKELTQALESEKKEYKKYLEQYTKYKKKYDDIWKSYCYNGKKYSELLKMPTRMKNEMNEALINLYSLKNKMKQLKNLLDINSDNKKSIYNTILSHKILYCKKYGKNTYENYINEITNLYNRINNEIIVLETTLNNNDLKNLKNPSKTLKECNNITKNTIYLCSKFYSDMAFTNIEVDFQQNLRVANELLSDFTTAKSDEHLDQAIKIPVIKEDLNLIEKQIQELNKNENIYETKTEFYKNKLVESKIVEYIYKIQILQNKVKIKNIEHQKNAINVARKKLNIYKEKDKKMTTLEFMKLRKMILTKEEIDKIEIRKLKDKQLKFTNSYNKNKKQ